MFNIRRRRNKLVELTHHVIVIDNFRHFGHLYFHHVIEARIKTAQISITIKSARSKSKSQKTEEKKTLLKRNKVITLLITDAISKVNENNLINLTSKATEVNI